MNAPVNNVPRTCNYHAPTSNACLVPAITTYTKYVPRTCNYHLHQIGEIGNNITEKACQAAVQSLIVSRIDFCNVLLAGLPRKQMERIQRIQKQGGPTLVKRISKHCHIHDLCALKIHWLPISQRVRYRIFLCVWKALQGQAPRYTQRVIQVYHPGRSLRSASRGPLLAVPRVNHICSRWEIIFRVGAAYMEVFTREPLGFGDKGSIWS